MNEQEMTVFRALNGIIWTEIHRLNNEKRYSSLSIVKDGELILKSELKIRQLKRVYKTLEDIFLGGQNEQSVCKEIDAGTSG